VSTRTYLRTRIDPSRRTAGLVAGDAAALGAFVWAGAVNHGYAPAAAPLRYLGALAPFLLAWVAVAALAGLYTSDATTTVRRAVGWAVPAWLVALPVAHGLRVVVFRGGTSPGFLAVSGLVGGTLLVGWRALTARPSLP